METAGVLAALVAGRALARAEAAALGLGHAVDRPLVRVIAPRARRPRASLRAPSAPDRSSVQAATRSSMHRQTQRREAAPSRLVVEPSCAASWSWTPPRGSGSTLGSGLAVARRRGQSRGACAPVYWDGTTARSSIASRFRRAPGTAVVRVIWAGICNTDLEICPRLHGLPRRARPRVRRRGRGGARRVDGQARRRARSTSAAAPAPECARGLGRHCPRAHGDGHPRRRRRLRRARRGARSRTSTRVPDGVRDEAAVFVEPLAAAFEILEQVHVHPGHRAAPCSATASSGCSSRRCSTDGRARARGGQARGQARAPRAARHRDGARSTPGRGRRPTSSSRRPGPPTGFDGRDRGDAPARHAGAEEHGRRRGVRSTSRRS